MANIIKIRTITQGLEYMKEKPYQCNECDATFPPKALLMNYFKVLIEENAYEISMYEKSLQHISRFINHLISHTVVNSIQTEANETCEETVNPHIDNSDQESFDSEPIVNTSHTEIQVKQPFKCHECGKSFSKKTIFYKHLKTHDRLKPFICSICNKAYELKADLIKHCKIHSGEIPPHTCNKCDKGFWEIKDFTLHVRTHIKWEENQTSYECNICDKKFNNKHSFANHRLTHTGNKKHQCSYCGKLFLQSQQLRTHLRTHTGEKPYICEHCGHGCTTNQSLLRHIEIHSTDRKKSHQCDLCKKCFFTDRALKWHTKRHTGDKPYKCRHCDISFTSNSNCVRHERKHTGEKPFKCTQCGKNFYRMSKCCEGLPTIKEAGASLVSEAPMIPIFSQTGKYDISESDNFIST